MSREEDLAEEIRTHLRMAVEERMAGGMSRADAERAARREFGNVLRVKEVTSSMWGGGGWTADVVQAVRTLRRNRGSALTIIATMALAVGATTAVYSVVHGVLLRPLPYPEPHRLARIWETRPDWAESSNAQLRSAALRLEPGAPRYYEWLETDTGFETLGGYVTAAHVLQGPDGASTIRGHEATSGFFEALGVQPILGRRLQAADDVEGAPDVVVLGESFWRTRLGGRSDAIGASILLNGRQHTVVGVMPAEFQDPPGLRNRHLPDGASNLWIPLTDEARRGFKNISVVGRLAPNTSLEAAATRLATVQARLNNAYPDDNRVRGTHVTSLLDSMVGGVRSTLWFLLGAVSLVLLVATVNIANMLTVLGLTRRRELAVRAALGAGAGRLMRGLFVESAVLAAIGGLGGVLVAGVSLPLLVRLLPPTLPRLDLIGMSPGVILAGIAATGVTALLAGTLPAFLAARAHPLEALSSSGRSFTVGRRGSRVRSGLVVAEVTLAFVLLVGAGLLANSYGRLWAVNRGFSPQGLVVMNVRPDESVYSTRENRLRFVRELRERFGAIPGISASVANDVPLAGGSSSNSMFIERPDAEAEKVLALVSVVGEGYLDVMDIPLVAGRAFGPGDTGGAPAVGMVNETMARLYWADGKPVGRYFRSGDDSARVQIVGVTADIKHRGLAVQVEPTVYRPAIQTRRSTYEWVLRVQGDVVTAEAVRLAREVVATLSPTTPVGRVLVLEETIADSVAVPRFRTILIVSLAGLAAVLALLGVYSVLAYSVTQRRKEIGVRIALGANPSRVLRDVVRSGLKLTMAGVLIGLLVTWRGADVMGQFLFEITPTDLPTYGATVLAVLVVGCMAAWLPARRAASVDPIEVFKGE